MYWALFFLFWWKYLDLWWSECGSLFIHSSNKHFPRNHIPGITNNTKKLRWHNDLQGSDRILEIRITLANLAILSNNGYIQNASFGPGTVEEAAKQNQKIFWPPANHGLARMQVFSGPWVRGFILEWARWDFAEMWRKRASWAVKKMDRAILYFHTEVSICGCFQWVAQLIVTEAEAEKVELTMTAAGKDPGMDQVPQRQVSGCWDAGADNWSMYLLSQINVPISEGVNDYSRNVAAHREDTP